MEDPYQTLGVSAKATQDEIKNAYRSLAKKFHPDLNPKNKAAEVRFKDINAAYEIVGDVANRAKFDRGEWGAEPGAHSQRRHGGPFYHEARAGAEAGAGGGPGGRYSYDFGDFNEDMFANIFGGRGRGGAGGFAMPGQDEQYKLEISLKEAVEGGARELGLPGGKRLAVKIPKGIVPGQKLRFAGQGGPGIGGGPAGDVFVELSLAPDERFSQGESGSLLHELAVPLDLAMLGGEITVPTPEGQVRLKVPPRTSSGRRLRIPGKGIFRRGGRERGDLFVRVLVSVPETPDEGLDAALKAWRTRQGKEAS